MIRCWLDILLAFSIISEAVFITHANLVKGIVHCMNNEDCIGKNRRCIHDKTNLTGTCKCKPGYVLKNKESFSCVKGPVMQQCDSDYDCREGDVCIIVTTPFLSDRGSLSSRARSKNQKICIGTWLIYAADFDEPRTGGGLKHYSDDIFFKRGRRVPQQYVGFVEDMMLVLFLVCILVTLITVHRASCYRQFQDARRNSPLRHILPIGDDQPPPYSERQDSVDGGGGLAAEVVSTETSGPKRQSETPPPSYEEALYRNSVQLPQESEARTNLANDELNDLDCLPSYNETRIRIFENIQPNSNTSTNTTLRVQQHQQQQSQLQVHQQPPLSECTENCSLLLPLPTSTNTGCIEEGTTTTNNNIDVTTTFRNVTEDGGIRSSCAADQEQQNNQQQLNTTTADNTNSSPAAVDHSRPPAVIVSSLPSPSDSVLSAPLGLNVTSSCSTSSLPTTAPTSPSSGMENQVLAHVELCCGDLVTNNQQQQLHGSTTKINNNNNSSLVLEVVAGNENNNTVTSPQQPKTISAIISDKSQEAAA